VFTKAKPIINIPLMHITTILVTFTKSTRAGQFDVIFVDSSYKGLRERFPGVASVQDITMGMTKPFGC